MKAIAKNFYARGKRGNLYVRRRIPAAIRLAYPADQTHIVRSLGTSDVAKGEEKSHSELALIAAEFEQKRQQLDLSRAAHAAKRVARLDDEQLRVACQFWPRLILTNDEKRREGGLTDEEFDSLERQLVSQREQFGRLLAQGRALQIMPLLQGFLFSCGLNFEPDEAEAKRVSAAFLRSYVTTLDRQLERQRGEVVDTDSVAPDVIHPRRSFYPTASAQSEPPQPAGPTWDAAFKVWQDFGEDRAEGTVAASNTAWQDLQRFAKQKGIKTPGEVSPEQMAAFVDDMRNRPKPLAVKTLNQRLSKIRGIYKIAVGKFLLEVNPARDTLGAKESAARKRQKRRLPFDADDLNAIFSSQVYTHHLRSRGQAREATYWIPILMHYTGARPEELAGLAITDLVEDPVLGWYFKIQDHFGDGDEDLFEEDEDEVDGADTVTAGAPSGHRRLLKNAMSARCVPVARQLIDLGLLRYVAWLREQGATLLFPTLEKDCHGKLSGAFSKFFGRFKRTLGIKSDKKVLYSFRHGMKDMLEGASMPSKYLKRVLGHSTGDGAVTDGYGMGVPFAMVVEHFSRVQFPSIPASPWQPGRGFITLK